MDSVRKALTEQAFCDGDVCSLRHSTSSWWHLHKRERCDDTEPHCRLSCTRSLTTRNLTAGCHTLTHSLHGTSLQAVMHSLIHYTEPHCRLSCTHSLTHFLSSAQLNRPTHQPARLSTSQISHTVAQLQQTTKLSLFPSLCHSLLPPSPSPTSIIQPSLLPPSIHSLIPPPSPSHLPLIHSFISHPPHPLSLTHSPITRPLTRSPVCPVCHLYRW